MKTTQRRINIF